MVAFLPIFTVRSANSRPHVGRTSVQDLNKGGTCRDFGLRNRRRRLSRMNRIIVLLTIFCVVGFASSSQAGIYRYEDENGVIHFTNCPRDSKFKLYIREKEDGAGKPNMTTTSYGYIRDSTAYDHLISESAQKYEIDFALVKAIIRAESGFNAHAVSKKGARGLMQLMPGTAQRMNVSNVYNPKR